MTGRAKQDCVIRLEERLRLAHLAPDFEPRLDELTIDQVVALRFASDAGRRCTNRHWPARSQSTGFSPADAIRHWSAEFGQPTRVEITIPSTGSLDER